MSRSGHGDRSRGPRVLVSGEKDGRWSAGGRTVDETLCTGVQSWVYAFDGDYAGHRQLTRRDLDRHDIVIVNLNRPLAPLVRLAQDRPASVRWVSLIEGSADEYSVPQRELKALLDASDLVNVINGHSLPLFRAMTTSKVAHIGMPYPVDGVRKFAVPVDARTRRIFLCAYLSEQWNAYLAARAIGLPYYGYEVRPPRPRGLSRWRRLLGRAPAGDDEHIGRVQALYRDLYADASLGVTTYTKDMTSYLTEHSRAYFWIDLDRRYTWARFVLDAAALAIPIITTASTYHGGLLFPDTTVAHPMDIERTVELGRRLSRDRDFYDRVARYPADKLGFLRAESMTRALLGALDML